MNLRFHEIAETYHRIMNPFADEKLMHLGQIIGLQPGISVLDLACGKGEMLCRWAQSFGISGVGVDLSQLFIGAACERARELGVDSVVQFVHGEASSYPQPEHQYDVVSCLGATGIGGGLVGTLEIMKQALRDDYSLLLVGEPYWIDLPPFDAYAELDVDVEEFATLEGTLDRFEMVGLELLEMVLADGDDWDRYASAQWMTVKNWLRTNPDDPDAEALRDWINQDQRAYLQYARRYFGWGVFVLRQLPLV
ncbi:MAG: methyltransferase domain-containing protein [Anaerolineae bacterium]